MNSLSSLAIVGGGRLGSALHAALPGVSGPFGRGFDGDGFDAVLLCVPDAEIAPAASAVIPGRLVGHCSGATTLAPLAPHEAFSVHPLMTVPASGADFTGVPAAVAGSTDAALSFAQDLSAAAGLEPFTVQDDDRAAYHAAASIASNFLVALEGAAERVLATTGAPRDVLVPLVRASTDNWARLGASAALTGPVARGDHETIARQRAAVADRCPELVGLFDELVTASRALVAA